MLSPSKISMASYCSPYNLDPRVTIRIKQSIANLKAVEPDLGDFGAVPVDLLGGRDVGEEGDGRKPPPRQVQARRRRHCASLLLGH